MTQTPSSTTLLRLLLPFRKMDRNRVIFTVASYLKSLKQTEEGLSQNEVKAVESALSSLVGGFPCEETPSSFLEDSFYPLGLPDLLAAGVATLKAETPGDCLSSVEDNPKFQTFMDVVKQKGYFDGTEPGSLEYLQRQAKLVMKFKEKAAAAGPSTTADKEKLAEEKKGLGNNAISSKNYEGAVQLYTEALELSPDGPQSHVYYCNRAAAHCHLNNYIEAVEDCQASVALVPDYVKAFSRLGLANYFLERYEEAVEAYERALELEPDNKATKTSLTQAKNKITDLDRKSAQPPSSSSSSSSRGTAAGGGAPDMSALAGMLGGGGGGGLPPGLAGMMGNPAMKSAMDRVGGADGLANLMKDPQMMAMAQQMMKDPKAMKQAMAMMSGVEGGGDMPDMSAMMGMMGGSSSSGKGKKGPFKGFEDEDA